jgi:hypothetical protein
MGSESLINFAELQWGRIKLTTKEKNLMIHLQLG